MSIFPRIILQLNIFTNILQELFYLPVLRGVTEIKRMNIHSIILLPKETKNKYNFASFLTSIRKGNIWATTKVINQGSVHKYSIKFAFYPIFNQLY